DKTIANTIIAQMGGNRALYMLAGRKAGAAVLRNGVAITVVNSPVKATAVEIVLDESDTYTVRAVRDVRTRLNQRTGVLTGGKVTINESHGLFVEDLRGAIEAAVRMRLAI